MALSDMESDVINELIRMSDSYTSIPSEEMYEILKESIKNASNGVAVTFYGRSYYRDTFFGGNYVTEELGRIASIVMCNTMRLVSLIFICYEYESK